MAGQTVEILLSSQHSDFVCTSAGGLGNRKVWEIQQDFAAGEYCHLTYISTLSDNISPKNLLST